MKDQRPAAKAPGEAARDEIVSVTELTWAVSRILNYVQQSKQRVLVSKHGYIVAAIVPASNDDLRG
jgi:antitoxin (DNA-binding transcriptional repressor) of toxin-antitoxin stability system